MYTVYNGLLVDIHTFSKKLRHSFDLITHREFNIVLFLIHHMEHQLLFIQHFLIKIKFIIIN